MSNILNKLIALLLLLLLLPVLIIVALIIFIDDGFPIIYTQRNYGKNHKPFDLYKFRTMKRHTPEMPTEEFNQPKKYLLKSGKFIRKFSIDELPQFFNILENKINFIGPRPCMVGNEEIVKKLREEHDIHTMKPGITGWAQVNGRDLNSYQEKVNLDKYYFENKNIVLDLKIVSKTFGVILFPKHIKH
jgi:O-antigen biosynthesis protein WbqP